MGEKPRFLLYSSAGIRWVGTQIHRMPTNFLKARMRAFNTGLPEDPLCKAWRTGRQSTNQMAGVGMLGNASCVALTAANASHVLVGRISSTLGEAIATMQRGGWLLDVGQGAGPASKTRLLELMNHWPSRL